MRDRPGRPDEPDDNNDQPDQPSESDHGDQPREQPDEADSHTDQPRKWHEFALDDGFDEDTARAAEQKQIMRAEGLDEAILTETFGTDEELGLAEPDEPEPSGWDEPGVAEHEQRPDLDEIHLPDDRRDHTVERHRSDSTWAGRTKFPESWSDDQIATRITDVARYPDEPPLWQSNGRWRVRGVREQVTIRAVIEPSGEIWTGYPEKGGPGVEKNK